MDKKLFFQNDLKERTSQRNVDIHDDMDHNDFFQIISKNVVFVDILIFSYIHMGKKRFLKVISNQRALSRKVDIFEHIAKKKCS